MPIGNLIEFVAGTKAKAQEVNYNFSTVKSFADALEISITAMQNSIAQLETTKANTNGDYRVRFSVADALNNFDAVNLQTMNSRTANSIQVISGLGITKVGDNTILVASGSAYETTYKYVLTLSTSVSKTNSSQGASTTYYVYIIGTESLSTDVFITPNSVDPPLPTDYIYYRRIGRYTTNARNQIENIYNEQLNQYANTDTLLNQNTNLISSGIGPNFSRGFAIGSGWVASSSGWLAIRTSSSADSSTYCYINGQLIYSNIQSRGDRRAGFMQTCGMVYISKGQTFSVGDNGFQGCTFYPVIGF